MDVIVLAKAQENQWSGVMLTALQHVKVTVQVIPPGHVVKLIVSNFKHYLWSIHAITHAP